MSNLIFILHRNNELLGLSGLQEAELERGRHHIETALQGIVED
jgi:hypothetical protein